MVGSHSRINQSDNGSTDTLPFLLEKNSESTRKNCEKPPQIARGSTTVCQSIKVVFVLHNTNKPYRTLKLASRPIPASKSYRSKKDRSRIQPFTKMVKMIAFNRTLSHRRRQSAPNSDSPPASTIAMPAIASPTQLTEYSKPAGLGMRFMLHGVLNHRLNLTMQL